MINPFPKKLEAKFIGRGRWKLIRPFVYNSKIGGKIEAPIDFVSDGASIPRIVWTIMGSPWSGRYASGSVIHDFLYYKQKLSRKKCDLIFLESMRALGVSWWKRIVIFGSLRMFGWIGWNNRAYQIDTEKKNKAKIKNGDAV